MYYMYRYMYIYSSIRSKYARTSKLFKNTQLLELCLAKVDVLVRCTLTCTTRQTPADSLVTCMVTCIPELAKLGTSRSTNHQNDGKIVLLLIDLLPSI